MKISICMTYFNRSDQLRETLKSISKFTIPDEIIIVDDASEDKADKVIKEFPSLPIIYKYISKNEKWWVNPCIPFNIGFKLCTGDLIIIQNSECAHYNDIVAYVKNNVTDKYHAFSTYSQNNKTLIEDIKFYPKSVFFCGDDGWYNHSIHRPKFYHFCSAISKENLDRVGGFDEDFANGFAYDDDAFIHDINKKRIEMINDDNGIAIHQFHYSTKPHPNAGELTQKNRDIFLTKIRR